VSYYHSDTLGSTRLITDSSQNIIFSNSYQPYGQDSGAPTGSATYKFTGKPWSISTNLYYFYMRWYDPSVGRFLSNDPKGPKTSVPESFNLYIYVNDSPTNAIDLSGEDWLSGITSFGQTVWNGIQTVGNTIAQGASAAGTFLANNVPRFHTGVGDLSNNKLISDFSNQVNRQATGGITWLGNNLHFKTGMGIAGDQFASHVTDQNKFFTGLGICAGITAALVGLALLIIYGGGPAIISVEGAIAIINGLAAGITLLELLESAHTWATAFEGFVFIGGLVYSGYSYCYSLMSSSYSA
jgi:RHS repeat-associated protein